MLFIVTLIVLFVRKNSIENTTICMKKEKGAVAPYVSLMKIIEEAIARTALEITKIP